MPDMFRNLRIGVVAVVNGDVTLQGLMGRASKLIHTWKAMKADGPFPTIAYQLSVFPQTSEDNDTRQGRLRLAVFDQGTSALERAENIAARLEAILTHAALIAAVPALDAAPIAVTRLYVDDATDEDEAGTNPAPARQLERVDIDIDFNLTQAA